MNERPATVPETSAPQNAGGHPDADAWIAYHEGELAAAEEERLRRHLVACPPCVGLLLDLDAFDTGAGEELSEFERAAAWRSMRAALGHEKPAARRGAARWLAVPSALAASLVAGVLGLALWNVHQEAAELRATVTALAEPQVNVPIRDLFPDTATRGGGETRPTEVPPAPFFTLVLNLEEPPGFPAYEVEIADAAGRVTWTGRGLEMSSYGTFTLGLARDFLTPGEEYRVRLYGVRLYGVRPYGVRPYGVRPYGVTGDARELLQDYPVLVE